jgi:hypothetical protein
MRISVLKAKLRRKIWFYLRDFFYYQILEDPRPIQNINFNSNPDQKKAIICYQTNSFCTNLGIKSVYRTQPFEIMKIVNSFSDSGYAIDIIDCIDTRALGVVKDKKYDLIFGFGETFYQLTNLHPFATSIFYMTESHPEFSYQEEKKRLDYFYMRYGRKLRIKRSGKYYKISHLQKIYSQVIILGETKLLNSQYSNPYVLFPTGLINPDFVFYNKDHLNTRKHFLWLGSTGAVHKGLDLLLDVFNQRDDIVLHICGLEKNDRKYLNMPKRKNIIEDGLIYIKSDTFLQLVNKCSYIILPSCSEGFSTSITTGMLHGLIPVVMRDTGFDRLGPYAIFLEDFKVDYLEMKLNELSNTDPAKLSSLSRQIFDFARQNFTIQVFGYNFKAIISDILKIK